MNGVQTPEELRQVRLRNDHKELLALTGDMMEMEAEGSPPERYELTVRVRSVISRAPTFHHEHRVEVTLGPGYPFQSAPTAKILPPGIFHPNWWTDGRWCYGGNWNPEEGLSAFVLRMIRTLQFDPAVINPDSPANLAAAQWYREQLDRGLFPTDSRPLPDVEGRPGTQHFVLHSRTGTTPASGQQRTISQPSGFHFQIRRVSGGGGR